MFQLFDMAEALEVLDAVRSLGLACPDDVAVIGVDDDEVLCNLASPNLTSVNQNLECIGYKAALLCTVFKKSFGLTPTEHRRECQPWATPST